MSFFKKFTVVELKTMCKFNFIEKYSKLKKQQLIDLLEQIEEPDKDYKILLVWSANSYTERHCQEEEYIERMKELFEDCYSQRDERYTWWKEYHCPSVSGMDYEDLEEQFGEELEEIEKEHPKWWVYDKYLVNIITDNYVDEDDNTDSKSDSDSDDEETDTERLEKMTIEELRQECNCFTFTGYITYDKQQLIDLLQLRIEGICECCLS